MRKRLTILALSTLIFTSSAATAPPPPQPHLPPPAAEAILTHVETGRQFLIPVTTSFHPLGNNLYEVTYEAEIPTVILAIYPYKENAQLDPTRSARVSIRQTYSDKKVGGFYYVAVHYYQGRWERIDPAVTVTKMQINAVCYGAFDNGGFCNSNTWSPTYVNPASGSWKTYTPSWVGRYVDCTAGGGQRGATKVWLMRGTTTWTFQVSVSCANPG